ncbi:hypothetical protein J437_LFUL000809 [Ladona fulva]|uniref:Alkaline phosphatase n=1 Tax=Ladona fulva TaxID=123851 RepID=A0A8K0PEJ4_LADFU|nr:hypothetical protein J437_LFUL000809 [Ladona fulva]
MYNVLLLGNSFFLPDRNIWMQNGLLELEESVKLQKSRNEGVARNVILFVGDGMGPNTLTASRVYKRQYRENTKHNSRWEDLYKHKKERNLIFEDFPSMGMLKTYAVDKQVPDSACTATALFCGAKTNYETVGVDESVLLGDCDTSLNQTTHLSSIMKWALDAGKDTGFVTNMRVTHATPSPLYAHCPDRRWECDGKMPSAARDKCKDIARQLIEDEPGRNIKVIMGGGRQCLQTNLNASEYDPLDGWACRRKDGLDLISMWKRDKESRNLPYHLLSNADELRAFNRELNTSKYLLGIFANSHLPYEYLRDDSETPSLAEMVITAINAMSQNPRGFLLVVEGGLIDIAHHRGTARKALDETLAMEEAVISVVEKLSLSSSSTSTPHSHTASGFMPNMSSETLLIVTSDHTHTMSINGYPKRDDDILGIASASKINGREYTTLSYANGVGFKYNCSEGKALWEDPKEAKTTSFEYKQQATVLQDEETHGGGDVTIYATGPMAHLFHRVHEQSYVAHVIAYASHIGPYSDGISARIPLSDATSSSSGCCLTKFSAYSMPITLVLTWITINL